MLGTGDQGAGAAEENQTWSLPSGCSHARRELGAVRIITLLEYSGSRQSTNGYSPSQKSLEGRSRDLLISVPPVGQSRCSKSATTFIKFK